VAFAACVLVSRLLLGLIGRCRLGLDGLDRVNDLDLVGMLLQQFLAKRIADIDFIASLLG
jgi:hypothetical protein